jgi:outer membrane murein-binding lipoprotein Lpp
MNQEEINMKKKLAALAILTIALLAGCNQDELEEKDQKISQLQQQVERLEIENKELKLENAKTTKKLQTILKDQAENK